MIADQNGSATTNGKVAHKTVPATVTPTDTGFSIDIDAADRSTVNINTGDQTTYVTPEEMTEGNRRLYDYIAKEQADRQRAEDNRANHRNRNRMLTLIFAFFISLVVTYILAHPGWILSAHACKVWGPYSFAITILMDSSLTVYAWARHY